MILYMVTIPGGKIMKKTYTLLNEENQEVLDTFMRNNILIDNHTGNSIEAVALVEYNSNTKPLGVALDYWCYCINEAYLDYKDKKLHLSTCSIGGNLYGTPTKEKIDKYNESALFDGGKIKRVWFHDGSIIELDLGDIDLENEEA